MYDIQVTARLISAAHRIPGYTGPCEKLHGHTWEVSAAYRKNTLDGLGMAIDMVGLRRQLNSATADMDHSNLCDKFKPPTAEVIARAIYKRLKKLGFGEFLESVKVMESPGAVVIYWEKEKVKEVPADAS